MRLLGLAELGGQALGALADQTELSLHLGAFVDQGLVLDGESAESGVGVLLSGETDGEVLSQPGGHELALIEGTLEPGNLLARLGELDASLGERGL